MIRIAVASEGNQVTEHFGHCRNFQIFDAEEGRISGSFSLDNPGHRPGFLPNFLHDQGVKVIISGGMGGSAVELFNGHGIEVVVGAQGDARTAAEAYLAGDLVSTGSVCQEHEHADQCED